MVRQDRLISVLTGVMALRRRRDYIVKPLVLLIGIHALANLVELLREGPSGVAFWDQAVQTTLVALPFLAMVHFVVTQMDRLQRQLADMATTDMLTGLRNRRAFVDLARGAGAAGGVVFLLDADHFKRINDTYGHAAGDACLQAIGRRLRAVLRQSDIVGRVGGEEFAAYLPGAPLIEAVEIGERLVEAISVPFDGPRRPISVTLSIGAAECGVAECGAPHSLEDLLHRADLALYEAKMQGRARLVVWQPKAVEAVA